MIWDPNLARSGSPLSGARLSHWYLFEPVFLLHLLSPISPTFLLCVLLFLSQALLHSLHSISQAQPLHVFVSSPSPPGHALKHLLPFIGCSLVRIKKSTFCADSGGNTLSPLPPLLRVRFRFKSLSCSRLQSPTSHLPWVPGNCFCANKYYECDPECAPGGSGSPRREDLE